MELHNTGCEATFSNKKASSIIDLTISRNLSWTIRDWKVDTEYNASDHNTIHFEVEHSNAQEVITPVILWKKANWKKFTEILTNCNTDFPRVMTTQVLEEKLGEFYAILDNARDEAIPQVMIKAGSNTNTWYTERCKRMRSRVAKLKRKYERKKSERNWIEYHEKHSEYKNFCSHSKDEAFKDYLETLPDFEELSKFHRGVIKKNNSELTCLLRNDGSRTEPGEDTLNEIIKTHFPRYTKIKQTKHLNKQISLQEIKDTAKNWISTGLIQLY